MENSTPTNCNQLPSPPAYPVSLWESFGKHLIFIISACLNRSSPPDFLGITRTAICPLWPCPNFHSEAVCLDSPPNATAAIVTARLGYTWFLCSPHSFLVCTSVGEEQILSDKRSLLCLAYDLGRAIVASCCQYWVGEPIQRTCSISAVSAPKGDSFSNLGIGRFRIPRLLARPCLGYVGGACTNKSNRRIESEQPEQCTSSDSKPNGTTHLPPTDRPTD